MSFRRIITETFFQYIARHMSLDVVIGIVRQKESSLVPGFLIEMLHEAATAAQSTIARATELLAETDWNADRYKLNATSVEEVENSLDGAAVDIVVLDAFPAGALAGDFHHPLLQNFLREAQPGALAPKRRIWSTVNRSA
jgi:hypothetical protein